MYQYRLILSLDKEQARSHTKLLYFTPETLDKNTTNEYAESKKLTATKLKLVVYQFGDIIYRQPSIS